MYRSRSRRNVLSRIDDIGREGRIRSFHLDELVKSGGTRKLRAPCRGAEYSRISHADKPETEGRGVFPII